jgi:hypothetical protein
LAVLLAERLEDPGVKLLFLGPPRPAKVRYRYWTDRRYEGWAGLVAARGRSRSPVFRGEGGTALVVYVFDAEGQLALVTTNLDWTDVEPPLYALEEIDRTRTGSRLAPRPLGLDAETESLFRSFRSTPVDELPSYQ